MSHLSDGRTAASGGAEAAIIWSLNLLFCYWIVSAVIPSNGLGPEKLLSSTVIVLSVSLLIGSSARAIRLLVSREALLLTALLAWSAVVVLRSVDLDLQAIATLIVNPQVGALTWVLPIVTLAGSRITALGFLMPTFRAHSVVAAIWCIVVIVDISILGNSRSFKDQWVQLVPILTYASPIVLTLRLGSVGDRNWHFLCMIIAASASFANGGRFYFVYCVVILIIYLYRQLSSRTRKWVLLLTSATILSVALIRDDINLLPAVQSDWTIDTRSFIVAEIYSQFDTDDWLFGRGALGTYYSRYFDNARLIGMVGDSASRSVSELGYLHLVLKGGVLLALLYGAALLLVAVCALRKGTRISVGVAILVVMHLAELAITGAPAVWPSRAMMWLLAGWVLFTKKEPEWALNKTPRLPL